jgi:D-sedoheptulose 7-phosphate isomerase
MTSSAPEMPSEQYERVARPFLATVAAALNAVPAPLISEVIQLLDDGRERNARAYVIGNGGSASTASHLACDLTKTAQQPGIRPLRVHSLSADEALLTAYANDVSYTDVFSRQLVAFADPDDLVIAISASGCSPNILDALRTARGLGLSSVGLLGCGGGAAAELVDLALVVDASDFGVIETVHLAIVHAVTAALQTTDPAMMVASGPGSAGDRFSV